MRLADFLFEIALQIQARLPDNFKLLQKVSAIEPRNILQSSDMRTLTEIAHQYQSGPGDGIDITGIESDCRRLHHTSFSVNSSTPMLQFWSSVADFKEGDSPLFPHITKMVSILVSLPCSNATVERLFSMMGVIKKQTKKLDGYSHGSGCSLNSTRPKEARRNLF